MTKLTGLMIGIVLFSATAALYGTYLGNLAVGYNVSYNNDTFSSYNRLTEIGTLTKETQDATTSLQQRTGALDAITGFFGDAFRSMLILTRSFGIFFDIVTNAFRDLNWGTAGSILATVVPLVVLILFIRLLLSTVLKRDI